MHSYQHQGQCMDSSSLEDLNLHEKPMEKYQYYSMGIVTHLLTLCCSAPRCAGPGIKTLGRREEVGIEQHNDRICCRRRIPFLDRGCLEGLAGHNTRVVALALCKRLVVPVFIVVNYR
jgi:hypothetical protein